MKPIVVSLLCGTTLAPLFPACGSGLVSIGTHDGGSSDSDSAGGVPAAGTGRDESASPDTPPCPTTTIPSGDAAGFKTPACEPQACVYNQQGYGVCRPPCFEDAAACPSGQVCTGASVCCADTPANECRSPSTLVCCPASGC
jgi:hypothetical protein